MTKRYTDTNLETSICFDELLELTERELNRLGFDHTLSAIDRYTENVYTDRLTGDVLRIKSWELSDKDSRYPVFEDRFYYNGIQTNPNVVVARA